MSDRTTVMIRTAGGQWRAPSVTAYSNEAELQQLLATTPSLMPGVGDAACAIEFPIPGAGSLDLLAIGPDGSVTLVECKLASNAEVRRAVIGQITSYAAGLWNLGFEDLDDSFHARTTRPLVEAVSEIAGDETFGAEDFRRAVTDNLTRGRFRLIIAVDAITPELKRIIEYLNAHTTPDVEILGLEVGYVADSGTEILLPAVHGVETAARKSSGQPRRRSVDEVYRALADLVPDAMDEIRRLGERIAQAGGYWQPGLGAYATMSAYLQIGPRGAKRSVLALYADPAGGDAVRMTVNFGSLAKELSSDVLEGVLQRLVDETELGPYLARVENEGFNSYPVVPLTEFAASGAANVLMDALEPHLMLDG